MTNLLSSEPGATSGDGPQPARSVARLVRSPQGLTALTLGALGVVYGDIGTSPLYAIQTVFTLDHGRISSTPEHVLGIISMVFWSILVVVSAKYVGLAMRADNSGEGGILALAAVARRAFGPNKRKAATVLLIGLAGACLFYGDSIITPAISVISSIEGLEVPYPTLSHLVVPLSAVVLLVLFAVQPKGTSRVGAIFGPVMILWFVAIAASGLSQVIRRPHVLGGLSPTYAVSFAFDHPVLAFVAMGAVVLAITGAEALYADMGHFGRRPITRAWFWVVFPALTLNYLGQAALILRRPATVANPFFLMLPSWAQVPMVLLATLATVIASQAVISGAFSVTRQAIQLGLLPPMRIRQTSERSEGQIYLPGVNWALAFGVLVLIVVFRHSARLATAYGVAVTGTFVLTTVLLIVVASVKWHWPVWRLVAIGAVIGVIELIFFAGNLVKIVNGGWLPLSVATVLFITMTTWMRGRARVRSNRIQVEGDLKSFIQQIREEAVPRVEGTAVYPHPDALTAPLAMRATLQHHQVLHRTVLIVSAQPRNVPHVDVSDEYRIEDFGGASDGIFHIEFQYGFFDTPDIPSMLRRAAASCPALAGTDPDSTSYFVSRASLHRGNTPGMAAWRKRLFMTIAHNAADPAEMFRLPLDRTVVMGTVIDV